MRRLCGMVLAGLMLVATGGAAPPDPDDQPQQRYEFFRIRMGVPFKIVLYAADEPTANKAARAAFRRVKELDRILSDYDPDSELMQLCRNSGPGKPVKVSPELFSMLQRSLELSRKTDGAFDVTVGPVVKLWRRARRRKRLPDPDALREALDRVGYELLRLNGKQRTVELLKPDMQLDLGGIAKGYAGDEALRVLKKHGISRALVDGGGDIVVGDPPPDRDGWRIEIETARKDPKRNAPDLLVLDNAAVATSGDAYQSLEIDGQRYSHIVDPETGLGLTTRSSVTVIAPDGTAADSLASAVSVLGPDRGLKLVDSREEAAARIVQIRNGRPEVCVSKRWSRFLMQN